MKKQLQESLVVAKNFMRKHSLLFISLKVLKLLIVLFLFSCGSKPEPSNTPDTILIDSIPDNAPGDSTNFRNEEEEEEEGEEGGDNPLVPQES